ncbi:metal-dependent hydrolase [Photobacterium angustum]|uniref:Metal-dependent hydrolase n=1 Tax=Photobacterium angustum TaxID=661 RepID=A0ABX5GZ34_PHOAN|nr:hypothetical protein C0W27_20940 [Photobacterium angustum]
MNVTGHLAIGAGTYLLIEKHLYIKESTDFTNETLFFSGLLACLFGSLLPDIDHPSSTFGKRVKLISYPLSLIFGHRGITHSLFALILIGYFMLSAIDINHGFTLYQWVIFSMMVGYLSHIIIDYGSPQGVQLFYPFRRNYRFVIYKTPTMQFIIYFSYLSFCIWHYFS